MKVIAWSVMICFLKYYICWAPCCSMNLMHLLGWVWTAASSNTFFNFYVPLLGQVHDDFSCSLTRLPFVKAVSLVFSFSEFSFGLVDIILLVLCRMIFFLTPFLHSFGHWVHKVSDRCCYPWNLFLCMVCYAEALAS